MAPTQTQDDRRAAIRAEAQRRRRVQADKDLLSRRICAALAARAEFRTAKTILFYVSFGDEVRTRSLLAETLVAPKRVVVPYCVGPRLELFRLEAIDELVEGTFHILEPRIELRDRADRRVELSQIDLVVVPGVAFDPHGARLGHGRGYYDRLLADARSETTRIALAFACQMFPEIPTKPHDERVDWIITEERTYQAMGH